MRLPWEKSAYFSFSLDFRTTRRAFQRFIDNDNPIVASGIASRNIYAAFNVWTDYRVDNIHVNFKNETQKCGTPCHPPEKSSLGNQNRYESAVSTGQLIILGYLDHEVLCLHTYCFLSFTTNYFELSCIPPHIFIVFTYIFINIKHCLLQCNLK